jgi:hypothetical protein
VYDVRVDQHASSLGFHNADIFRGIAGLKKNDFVHRVCTGKGLPCTRSTEPKPGKTKSHHFPTLALTPLCISILISVLNFFRFDSFLFLVLLSLVHITTGLRFPPSIPCELLPSIVDCGGSGTRSRNSVGMVRVGFPCNSSITRNVDILVPGLELACL